MTSKELAVLPPNAVLVEEYSGIGPKIYNGLLLAMASFPATAFYGMGLDGSFGDITMPIVMGSLLTMVIFVTSPFEIKGVQETEATNFSQFLKLRLAKVPFVSNFVNEDIEWTKTDYYGIEKDQKRLTVVRKGKVSVYNLDTIDPKEIWDRMYKKEIGEDIAYSIGYYKTVKKLLPQISPGGQNNTGTQGIHRSLLKRLLG